MRASTVRSRFLVFRACAKRVSTPAGSRPVEREGKLGLT